MAAHVNRKHAAGGQRINTGDNNEIITGQSLTEVIKAGGGKIGQLVIANVGTGWQIDIYDDPAAANNLVYTWVTADGKGVQPLQMPMQAGIVVVTNGGTPGRACLVWS